MPQKVEDRVQRLRQLRSGPSSPETTEILRKALTDRSNLVIAEAARTAAELNLRELIPDLLRTFDGLFDDAAKKDPKCSAKTAIVKTLVQLDYNDSAPFIRGALHIQKEPVYGGQEDTAIQLRGNSLLALIQCTDLKRFEILSRLVDGLSDPAESTRIEVVRALNQMSGDESVLLLRLKARLGDESALVIGHVFDALLNVEGTRALSFVAEYLKSSKEGLRDEAALALGASRLSKALEMLIAIWKETRSEAFSEVVLRAISSSRLPEAIEFLLDVLKTGTPKQSAAAAEALKLHEGSPEIEKLVEEARKAGKGQ